MRNHKHKAWGMVALLLMAGLTDTWAQRTVSSFEEIKMREGENLYGQDMTLPDQYFIPLGDGTYKVRRLTVTPSTSNSPCTVPYLQMLSDTSVYVCWKTSSLRSEMHVRYGRSGEERPLEVIPTVTKLGDGYFWHKALLTGLHPATAYDYQVTASSTDGPVYTFHTLDTPGQGERLRVLVIGDHQHNERSDYEWLCRAAERTAQEKWGEGPLASHVQFILNVGDQVDRGLLVNYENVHLFKNRLYSPMLPTMTCVGNHDGYADTEYVLYSGHYPYSELSYQGIQSGTSTYYAYQAGRVLFVVLNSDGASASQNLWLRKVVAAANLDEGVDFIVAAQHRPLYAEQYSNDVSPWMLHTIMPILEASPKFVLDLAGHHHLYARGQMTDTPVYHVITGGGVGISVQGYEQLWGQTPDNHDWDEVQKTIDHWTYQLLDFDYAQGTLTVESYSVGNSRLVQDNVLVDRFTRNLKDTASPETPVLASVPESVVLPYTFSQTTHPDVYATQYQIARDEAFTQLVLDRVVTKENMYGVDDKMLPLDLHAGKPTTQWTVEEWALSPTTYYIRTRNRNGNLQWSDFSPTCTFTVSGTASQPATVEPAARFIRQGDNVDIRYTGAPVGTSAWIGIYHTNWNGKSSSLRWQYTQKAAGTAQFDLNEPGDYMAVLFADNGYTEIARSQPFIVSKHCTDEQPYRISLQSQYLDEGAPLDVTLQGAPAIKEDWVGVYSEGQEPAASISLTWAYTQGMTDGTISLNVPNVKGTLSGESPFVGLREGNYYVQYFPGGYYCEMTPRIPFMVGKAMRVDMFKPILAEGEEAIAVYEGAPTWEAIEVVITDESGKEAARLPLPATAGGTLRLGRLAPGIYKGSAMTVATGTAVSPTFTFQIVKSTAMDLPRATTDIRYETGSLCIETTDGQHLVTVCSANGQVVNRRTFTGTRLEWPLRLPDGIYLVHTDTQQACKIAVHTNR
ncbi:MAG: metallophosphoesterase [Bacteroidaceae bacterium]